ncbi:MAG TPA: ostA-like family protein [Alphaproteobacteria bacterium]|nr:ostA-like family protein [Alphaproteobacteria bacterium]USO05326.1 MAG: ostA-like family protein [Rhodospirillales bacterium]HOO81407.1 ostA-like family protein [Alphaproteobacteria bacterium]
MKCKPFFILILLLTLSAANAQAQGLNTNSKDPLEITADGTLEWLRGEKLFVATKNARAKQGDASVEGGRLSAYYREGKDGNNMQIWKVTADTNVILKNRDTIIYGENAHYDLDQSLATMTGGNLKMISPDQTVTARDKFEYWAADGRVNAIGNAQVVRPKIGGGQDTLRADKISAVLKNNAGSQQVLHSLEAIGNVVIITPTETVTGAYGIYKADTNIAELTGGVKILRGPNTLEGQRAVVNLNTNISTIHGGDQTTEVPGKGQVRGVFYPGSQDKTDTP